MQFLREPLTVEQRDSVRVLAYVRWLLIGALLVIADYPVDSDPKAFYLVGALLAIALLINVWLHWVLLTERPIPTALPLGIGVFDALAVTVAIAVINSFDNTAFLLYYPALMALSATFPGRISLTYAALVMAAYIAISLGAYGRFDYSNAADWRLLGFRVSTMAATILVSFLVVRVERRRRVRAVAAEAERQHEVRALEQRAREQERAVAEERARLVADVHDGLSQDVYMLSLGLEGLAGPGMPELPRATAERVAALTRLSKQALFESRGLMFDLTSLMAGDTSIGELVTSQAGEFRAVTGIATSVRIEPGLASLPPASVAEVYIILHEAMANVYKHACARRVHIGIDRVAGGVLLEIADDGTGFDAGAHASGLGLGTMRQRAERIGARLRVDSSPGEGTRVSVRIPVAEVSGVRDPRTAG